jgi:membrane associated rhomboid family serine protease
MAWSDRRYEDDSGFIPRQPQDGLLIILGLCVGLHLLKVLLVNTGTLDAGWVERTFGASANGLADGHLWQALSYQFIHGDIWHLLWNCLMLFFAGRLLEGMVGRKRFLGMYLACGAVGALGTLFDAGMRPVVGSSGSIMGVLAILMVMVPNLEVQLLIITVRMKWLVLAFTVIDLCFALGDGRGATDNVSHWTHLFGAVGGFSLAWVWPVFLRPRIERARKRHERRQEVRRLEARFAEEQELDRILAKITQEGMPSLTSNERAFLEAHARKSKAGRRD